MTFLAAEPPESVQVALVGVVAGLFYLSLFSTMRRIKQFRPLGTVMVIVLTALLSTAWWMPREPAAHPEIAALIVLGVSLLVFGLVYGLLHVLTRRFNR